MHSRRNPGRSLVGVWSAVFALNAPAEKPLLGFSQMALARPSLPTIVELRIALDQKNRCIVVERFGIIHSVNDFELLKCLIEPHRQDFNAGRAPENYQFTRAKKIQDS